MSSATEASLNEQRTNVRQRYKEVETSALHSLIQEEYSHWTTRYVFQRISDARPRLPEATIKTAAADLTKSNQIRQQANALWPSASKAYKRHQHWITVIEDIIELLKLPVASVLKAEEILERPECQAEEEWDISEVVSFVEEIDLCVDMVVELWKEASEGRRSFTVAHYASSSMCRYIESLITSTQLSYSEWFNNDDLKREYFDKVEEQEPAVSKMLGKIDINDVKKFFRTCNAVAKGWDDSFRQLAQKGMEPCWPYLEAVSMFPIEQGHPTFKPTTEGRVMFYIMTRVIDLDVQLAKRAAILQLLQVTKFLRSGNDNEIVRHARKQQLMDRVQGLSGVANKATDIWNISIPYAWAESTIFHLSGHCCRDQVVAIVLYLYEYARLLKLNPPIVRHHPERFEALCGHYSRFLFWTGDRPRTIEQWKESVNKYVDVETNAEAEVAVRIHQRRQQESFCMKLVNQQYRVEGLLPEFFPPTKRWWERLQTMIDREMPSPNLLECHTKIEKQYPDLNVLINAFKACKKADHQNKLERKLIQNTIQSVPLDGNWLPAFGNS